MKIIIYSEDNKWDELYNKVTLIINDLWLSEFLPVEINESTKLKKELWISKEYALIIEEDLMDYIDIIFEWITPSDDDIKSIISSIIWWSWDCPTDICWTKCNLC